MKLVALTLLVPIALIGCSSDPDGDGLSNKEEAELGTDPDSSDSDGDGIDDSEEIADGLDPLSADSDGDGLPDGDEHALGADPLMADSDGDGIVDGLEADNDSDPTNKFSWPGNGIWPDFSANAPESTTYGMGEVLPNLMGRDLNREEVNLNQFYGNVILLDFSAGWCGPCNTVAAEAEEEWNDHRDEGYVIVHAMVDGWDGPANNTFINEWIGEHGLSFPVLGNGTIEDASYGLFQAGLNEGFIPYLVLLDSEMRIDRIYEGSGNDAAIRQRVSRLLEDVE